MKRGLLQNVTGGTILLPVVKHISQEKINCFAIASGAVGQVHVDPEFCQGLSFKTTLAHGYLIMAYVCEMMENNFGAAWMGSGALDVKFTGAARPCDSVIVLGTVLEAGGPGERIICEVTAVNQERKTILVGKTELIKE